MEEKHQHSVNCEIFCQLNADVLRVVMWIFIEKVSSAVEMGKDVFKYTCMML